MQLSNDLSDNGSLGFHGIIQMFITPRHLYLRTSFAAAQLFLCRSNRVIIRITYMVTFDAAY
jgi:hypothetical protein